MTPIIDPMVFYWMNAIHTLNQIIFALIIIGIALTISLIIGAVACYLDENDIFQKVKNYAIISLVMTIVFSIAIIFIPNKETLTNMTISSVITEDNINNLAEGAKETIDYIFDKIQNISD